MYQILKLFITLSFLILSIQSVPSQQKCKQLEGLQQRSGNQPIKLETSSFRNLILDKPRNYSVVVTLTALGAEFGCQACR